MSELNEVAIEIEKEVAHNEESSKRRSITGEILDQWQVALKSIKKESNTYFIDIQALPSVELREMVEKEFDVVKRIIFQIDEDAEVRLEGLRSAAIKDLTASDVGKLIQVHGVIRSFDEERRVDIVKDCWECDAGHLSYSRGPGPETEKCKFPTKQKSARNKPLPCGAPFIRQVFSEQKRQDVFAIRVEEYEDDPELDPGIIDVQFTGSELVRDVLVAIKANEKHITVGGVIKLTGSRDAGTGMSLYIDATSFERVEHQYTSRFDNLVRREIPPNMMRSHVMKLVRSFCPHIAGRVDVKTGMLVACVGAAQKKITAGSKIRGEINLLMLGSPGTGKTQMCKFAEKIRPNAVYVSGRQVTPIGLTAGVDWSEKPIAGGGRRRQVYMGAYAQANDSIAIIDEIHKRDRKDLEHLASVMDDNQELIVAQQGIFRKLSISVGSIHAGNPRTNAGMYDKKMGLIEQMASDFWLISRYDLIFVLTKEDQRDNRGSMRHAIAEMYRTIKPITSVDDDKALQNNEPLSQAEERVILDSEFYPPEYMAAEVEYLRTLDTPMLEVNSPQWDLMMEFWEKFSSVQVPDNLADVFDNRKSNSIARVAEVIARLYRSPKVEMDHMEEAISLFHSGINNIIKSAAPDVGYVRFAEWLLKAAIDQCYLCRGKGCNACGGVGGSFIPITFEDCSDYPYPSEARDGWDYLRKVGALVQMDESLGGQTYRVTSVVRDIAMGEWREREDKDIAREALGLVST